MINIVDSEFQKIDLVIQYALLVAGEEDEYFDRELGPIHLIKYAYIGDLEFAYRRNGLTYTSARWQFYNFGPWSQAVYSRIEPALLAISAERRVIEGNYGNNDEFIRWRLKNDYLLGEIEKKLPLVVRLRIKKDIHKFKQDTSALLQYVYNSEPMLNAAPNEYLDFSALKPVEKIARTKSELKYDSLSNKKKKQLRGKIETLRGKHQAGQYSKSQLDAPATEPRYDRAYFEGIEWLDQMAGGRLGPGEYVANFPDAVWKSQTRKGGDVS